MKHLFSIILFLGLSIMLFPMECFTHGGGLDGNGGHFNRKTGEYHYHQKKSAEDHSKAATTNYRGVETFSSQKTTTEKKSYTAPANFSHDELTPGSGSQDVNAYFRSANENVGAFDCNMAINERDLSAATKRAVKERDGNRCVICGSTRYLEVDHMRGLQNGGSNDPTNLATLCDDCHIEKTAMDGSLRRKRDKLCNN